MMEKLLVELEHGLAVLAERSSRTLIQCTIATVLNVEISANARP